MTDQSRFLEFIKKAGFDIEDDYPHDWDADDKIVVQVPGPAGIVQYELAFEPYTSAWVFDKDGNFSEHMIGE